MNVSRPLYRFWFALALCVALGVWLLMQPLTARADGSAGDFGTLAAAITDANADPGHDTITLTANITLAGNLPLIVSDVTVEGNGYFVSGNDQYRVFFVGGGITETAPTVTFRNLTIQHGRAQGGAGGGGAGLGGGLFIYSGTVATENVLFAANQALGGIGAALSGGGGLGGDGGEYLPVLEFGGGGGGSSTGGCRTPRPRRPRACSNSSLTSPTRPLTRSCMNCTG